MHNLIGALLVAIKALETPREIRLRMKTVGIQKLDTLALREINM
jgi:hypothetical protein